MITPGIGYTFRNSPDGFSLEIEQQSQTTEHPFKVYEDSTPEGTAVLRISAGSINNQLPLVGGSEIGTPTAYLEKPAGSGFVILYLPASPSSGAAFPSASPLILFNDVVEANDDSSAYVAIARIQLTTTEANPIPVMTISQLVTGSLWGERFECGNVVDYWFSQI
jgi:hypothetical protein